MWVEELAILLAAEPDAVAKLLDEHRDDGRGRQGYQVSPCALFDAAWRAAQARDVEASR